jgi:hypothetical protein
MERISFHKERLVMFPFQDLTAPTFPKESQSERSASHWPATYFDPIAAFYGLAIAIATVGFVLYCAFRPITVL